MDSHLVSLYIFYGMDLYIFRVDLYITQSGLIYILQSGLILYLYIHINFAAKIYIVDIYVLVNLYSILLISTLVFYRWCVPSRRGQCSRNCIYM